MATLAQELANDFLDSDDENENLVEHQFSFGDDVVAQDDTALDDVDNADEMETDEAGAAINAGEEDGEEVKARVEKMELHNKIEHYTKLNTTQQEVSLGNVEDNPEYRLLTQSNAMSTSIDGEIMLVHKFIRDHYSVRFPELEKLVENPVEYAKVVKTVGNDITNSGLGQTVKDNLRQLVPNAISMTVNLEATKTSGTVMPESELLTVQRACEMMLRLDHAKKQLSKYVQSRMAVFAPNLTVLIGSQIAAQLINFTAGISGLAKTPDRNLPSLGNKTNRKALGFATNTGIRNQGFLFRTEVVESVPTDLKVQAMRILSAKIILAARVDAAHESPNGDQGREFLDQVYKRLDKLSEVPGNKSGKALPAPDDKPARKRGGRRARKAKEAVAMTDIRKAQNRMAFGQEEAETGYGTGDSTVGLGMIGMKEDGRVRAQQVDQRTRARLSKKNPGWGGAAPNISGIATPIGAGFSGLRTHGVGSSGLQEQANGTMSNVAFTPIQGIQLVDPKLREQQNRKRKADEDRWFASGTFTQVNSSGPDDSSFKTDSAGFKIPSLPAKKAKKDG